MSEKRFSSNFDEEEGRTITDNGNELTQNEVVDLLNELLEEKEYFERKKEHFLSKWSIAYVENIQLRQENKELKKENRQLQEGLNDCKFILCQDDLGNYEIRYDDKVLHFLWEVAPILNEQQAVIEELKTYNLQHFLEWLVIEKYVTDEQMKDINNVIDCVNKFKEYLTDEYFETIRGGLEKENEKLKKY